MNSGNWELRPTEIITAANAGVRVCVFMCADGTYMFMLQRHETEMAGSHYLDRWADIGTVAMKVQLNMEDSFRRDIREWSEALSRAASALAALVEYVGYEEAQ